jgi:site-specific recombinase XerD
VTPPPFLPAATGWRAALDGYLEFLTTHKGVGTNPLSGWLRRFTRQVEPCAPSPSSLTLACVDAWVAELSERGKSARTVRGYVGAVRAFIRWLYDERLLASDLATFIESPLTWRDATVPQHFTWQEVQQLLQRVDPAAASARHDAALLFLFASCGLRPAEVTRLAIADVDFERQTVRIRNRKNGSWLVMPLPLVAVTALRYYLERERPSGVPEAFFLTVQGRPYRDGSALSRQVRRIAEHAGLGRQRGAQALRRAVGTRLVEQGATLPQVALMLGHEGMQSSRHYVRVSMAMLAEVADNYAELL